MIFRDRFVARLDDDARIVELAPGAWQLGRVGGEGASQHPPPRPIDSAMAIELGLMS